MVAQNLVRTFSVNQVFRVVADIWLHLQSHQIRHIFRQFLLHTYATFSDLPSYKSTMGGIGIIIYKDGPVI